VAGNAVALLQRKASPKAPKPPKPRSWPVAIPTDPAHTIAFQTQKAKLGSIEVHFTGRLGLAKAATTLTGEEVPKPLPKGTSASAWVTGHVRELAVAALNAATPTGDERRVRLDIGGEALALDLAPGLAGLPPFAVSGHFRAGKRALAFGSASLAGATVTLDATAWISPAASKDAEARPPAGDSTIVGYAFAGDGARFVDTYKVGETEIPRTGAVTLWDSVKKMETELPREVLDHPYLRLPEQRVSFLTQMRHYFGTDERTLRHFKGIRKVKLAGTSDKHPLLLHDEAATRLEKVQEELGAANTPRTTVGWPRSETSLGGEQTVGNLHNMGFAVDFNAYETPHLKSEPLRDLLTTVTGSTPEINSGAGWYTQGGYDEMMAGGAEQRDVMPEPDPESKLGKLLVKVEEETTRAYERSEKFRASLDTKDAGGGVVSGAKELQKLRDAYHASLGKQGNPAAWGDQQRKELAQLLAPWTTLVDAALKKEAAKLTAAGFSVDALKTGKALKKEEDAVKDAAKAARALRGKIKSGTLGKQRKEVEKRVKELRGLLARPETPAIADLDEAALLSELDTLKAAADLRLGSYGVARWYNRMRVLRAKLDSPAWVLGSSGKLAVSDPAPAQLVGHGYFTLEPTATFKKEAFSVTFVKTMVKHGFTHGGTWGTPDFMHFELRWSGPAS